MQVMLLYDNKQKKNGKHSIGGQEKRPIFTPVKERTLHTEQMPRGTTQRLQKYHSLLFLCPDHNFQIAESNVDQHDILTDFGDDDSDAHDSCRKYQKCEIDLTCNIDHKTSTQCYQFYQDQQMEMTQKHKCDQSKNYLDMARGR